MFGFDRSVRWRSLLPGVGMLVSIVAKMEGRSRCTALDLDDAPHWLYRDLGFRDGKPTEAEMRRPPEWPDGNAR